MKRHWFVESVIGLSGTYILDENLEVSALRGTCTALHLASDIACCISLTLLPFNSYGITSALDANIWIFFDVFFNVSTTPVLFIFVYLQFSYRNELRASRNMIFIPAIDQFHGKKLKYLYITYFFVVALWFVHLTLSMVLYVFHYWRTLVNFCVEWLFFSKLIFCISLMGQFMDVAHYTEAVLSSTTRSTSSRALVRNYFSTLKVCSNYMKVYQTQIFLTVLIYFTMFINVIYAVVSAIEKKELNFAVPYIVLWILNLVLYINCLVNICIYVESLRKRFNESLYNRMMEDTSGRLADDEYLQFHFTAKREQQFTGCGFFRLNNSLPGSMLVASMTYLVVLLDYSRGIWHVVNTTTFQFNSTNP